MKIRTLIAALTLAIAVIGVVVLNSTGSRTASHEVVTASPGGATGPKRTVLVSTGHEPAPSLPGRVLHALRMAGGVPSSPTPATVISDSNCSPDARGISHCTNALRLRNGRILTVRHPHRMMEVPCLEPGEGVVVRRT